jgi:hypothetical protein
VPRLKVLLFRGEKTVSVKHVDLRDMFQKAAKSACTSSIVVFPDPLPPTPSTSSAMKTPENKEEDPDISDPADGDI